MLTANWSKSPTWMAPNWQDENTIGWLEVTIRAANALSKAYGNISIDALCEKTAEELLRLDNFGRKSLKEVEDALARRGKRLRDKKCPS